MSGADLHTVGDDYLERGGTLEQNGQNRTPPHGDALMNGVHAAAVKAVDDRYAATARAMAGPEIPHNEAGVPIMKNCPCVIVPVVRQLPSHIERAARKAYAAGHRDGCGHFMDGEREGCDDQRGVDAFRESLRADAEEAMEAAGREYVEAGDVGLVDALKNALGKTLEEREQ